MFQNWNLSGLLLLLLTTKAITEVFKILKTQVVIIFQAVNILVI